MTAQKNITIVIKADGEVVMEANNFQGQGCMAATKEFQLVLAGDGPVDDKKKPDFFQSATGGNKVCN